MTTSHIIKIILFAFILKFLYVGFAFTLKEFDDDFAFANDTEGIIGLFKRHDSYWYQSIHNKGYPEVDSKLDLGWNSGSDFHQSRWGFMPGYPLATKGLSLILNSSFQTSSFVLSIVLSLACFVLFYWLACIWFHNNDDAFFSTLLFMAMPFQYYFSMMYAEALFCTLLMGSFLAVQKRNYVLLAIFTALNVIVRPVGLLMLLPISLLVLKNENLLTQLKIKREVLTWNSLKKFSFLLLPILSFSGYCIYQFIETGYPNAYSIAQQGGWYREFMFPLAGLFRKGDFTTQFTSWYAIAIMIIAVIAWKKLPLSFNLVVWICILLPLTAGRSTAMTRYVTIIFPLFWMYAYWLRNVKWRMLLIPVLVGLQLFTFYFWLVSDSFSQ